jgi:hypothetical protein
MSVSREQFELIRKKSGRYASWAVWQLPAADAAPKAGIGDLDCFDLEKNPDLLDELTAEVVMIGLNASSREVSGAPWFGFHDPSPHANDFKIRYAFRDTPYWGAYMTDVFNDFHETNSQTVTKAMKAAPEEVDRQLDRLEDELECLGVRHPLLIVFGGAAYRHVRRRFGTQYRVVQVLHFSSYVSKEKYRAKVLETLAAFEMEARS